MFNSMNWTATIEIARSLAAPTILITALALLAACGGSGSTTSGGGAPAAARVGVVAISGAVNRTYTPEEALAQKVVDQVNVRLIEKDACGVSLQFPIDLQPGTYPIEDVLNSTGATPVKVWCQYDIGCLPGEERANHLSTSGKLVLTSSGGKYSGSFEFTAKHNKDQSKTIQVSGAFNDASLP